MEELVGIVAILSACSFPTIALHLRQRHKERMKTLETQASAMAALEVSRAELEVRVRTLESIVTAGDQDLESRLRQLAATADPPRQPGRLQSTPG